jgi:hypothetical protein
MATFICHSQSGAACWLTDYGIFPGYAKLADFHHDVVPDFGILNLAYRIAFSRDII